VPGRPLPPRRLLPSARPLCRGKRGAGAAACRGEPTVRRRPSGHLASTSRSSMPGFVGDEVSRSRRGARGRTLLLAEANRRRGGRSPQISAGKGAAPVGGEEGAHPARHAAAQGGQGSRRPPAIGGRKGNEKEPIYLRGDQ
jgi:hypothetical protein